MFQRFSDRYFWMIYIRCNFYISNSKGYIVTTEILLEFLDGFLFVLFSNWFRFFVCWASCSLLSSSSSSEIFYVYFRLLPLWLAVSTSILKQWTMIRHEWISWKYWYFTKVIGFMFCPEENGVVLDERKLFFSALPL